jgi:hypothetical protein
VKHARRIASRHAERIRADERACYDRLRAARSPSSGERWSRRSSSSRTGWPRSSMRSGVACRALGNAGRERGVAPARPGASPPRSGAASGRLGEEGRPEALPRRCRTSPTGRGAPGTSHTRRSSGDRPGTFTGWGELAHRGSLGPRSSGKTIAKVGAAGDLMARRTPPSTNKN